MTHDEDVAGGEGVRVPREPDREELRRAARARALKNLAAVSLILGVVVLLGFSAWTVTLIRDTQVGSRTTLQQARNAAAAAKVTADRIEDCTSPGGACFERAQRQTSGAVAGINTITVRAAACMTAILQQYPHGQQVNVDAVANQIQQCIRTTTTTVKPQKVVPAPAPRKSMQSSTTSSPTAAPTPQVGHPKGPGGPGTPTPSPTTPSGTGPTDVLCMILPLSPICS